MKERILTYRKMIDDLLEADNQQETVKQQNIEEKLKQGNGFEQAIDWEALKSEHLIQISFFQHERLIHLIVTVCFALMTIMVAIAIVITGYLPLAALLLLLLVLLIPYISHYYLLENEVQKMYVQYDKICALCKQLDK